MIRWIVALAGILGLVGVMLGAYAAHGMEKSLAEQGIEAAEVIKRVDQCNTGVRYHMLHTLALLALGLTPLGSQRTRQLAAGGFVMGIAMFSGGLYSMSLLGVAGHWAIVPVGGLFFMVGWLATSLIAVSTSNSQAQSS